MGPRSKTTYLRIAGFALSGAGLVLLLVFAWPDDAPRYKRARGKVANLRLDSVYYDFGNLVPFSQNKGWIFTTFGTNRAPSYFFDLKQKLVIGSIEGGTPIFTRQNKFLVRSSRSPLPPWREKLYGKVEEITGRKIRFNRPDTTEQLYWVLDEINGQCRKIGITAERPNGSARPSPDGKRAFFQYQAEGQDWKMLMADLVSESITVEKVLGWPRGWWDNAHILTENEDGLLLYDFAHKTYSVLFSAEALKAFCEEKGLPPMKDTLGTFFMPNGKDYDIYLTYRKQRFLAAEASLVKLDKNRTLKLIDPAFKFEWSDQFDSSGRYYVYSGREAGQQTSAVVLRDLKTGTSRILVPEDKNYFSIPTFYDNTVLFIRKNRLWQVNLDGSNLNLLFPPQ
jgi:hypothetical protein